jgi:hypothetical protein
VTYKQNDWLKMCAALAKAQASLQAVRDGTAQRDDLDDAIINLWRFAEYAVNVVLEMAGEKPEMHHHQPERVKDLQLRKLLSGDYVKRLEQLNQYRLRAFYAGYNRVRSVHYSPRNVEDCLESLIALQQEVEALLRDRNKLA